MYMYLSCLIWTYMYTCVHVHTYVVIICTYVYTYISVCTHMYTLTHILFFCMCRRCIVCFLVFIVMGQSTKCLQDPENILLAKNPRLVKKNFSFAKSTQICVNRHNRHLTTISHPLLSPWSQYIVCFTTFIVFGQSTKCLQDPENILLAKNLRLVKTISSFAKSQLYTNLSQSS